MYADTDATPSLYELVNDPAQPGPFIPLSQYFGTPIQQESVWVREAFVPGYGWKTINDFVTVDGFRAMREQGGVAVNVTVGSRSADFQLSELFQTW